MHSGVNHSASDHWIDGKATIGFLYLVFSPRCFVFGMLIFPTRTLRYLIIIILLSEHHIRDAFARTSPNHSQQNVFFGL